MNYTMMHGSTNIRFFQNVGDFSARLHVVMSQKTVILIPVTLLLLGTGGPNLNSDIFES